MREAFEAPRRDLNICLQTSKARMEKGPPYKEMSLEACRVTLGVWQVKCQQLENTKGCAQHWKDRFDTLKRESLTCLGEREHLNENLDTYEGTIRFMHVERNECQAKFTSLVEFCNWMT